MLPVRLVSLTGQTGPILTLATLLVRLVLTEPYPKFTPCKLQLLNSFFTYNQPLGKFKEEILRKLKQLDNPEGLFKNDPITDWEIC